MLADDASSKIFVSGLVLIDSPYHIPWSKLDQSISEPEMDGTPFLVQKSLDNCDALLRTWELPQWEGPACDGHAVRFTHAGSSVRLPPGQVLYKPLQGEWQSMDARTFHHAEKPENPVAPPPAVMVRCVECAPTKDAAGPCRIDLFREERILGWDGNYPDFIKAVIEADAQHFNIFEFGKVGRVVSESYLIAVYRY